MMVLRRLARSLVAGIICGTVVLLLVLRLTQLYNLNPQHNDVVFFPLLILAFFLPMFSPTSSMFNLLVPFALWFIVEFGVGLVTRSSRATLFICIGLFVLYVLSGFVFLFLLSKIL